MAEQTISIPFGSGVDTKTDPKMLPAPKLTLLQDCIFTNRSRLTKRPGYDAITKNLIGGGVWSSPTMVKSYKDQLVIAATTSNGQRLLNYSPNFNAWEDCGKYLSVSVKKKIVANAYFNSYASGVSPTSQFGYSNSSSVSVGNLSLYAYDKSGTSYGKNLANSGTSATYISVIDTESGTYIKSASNGDTTIAITNAVGFSKAAIIGASTFAVFYITSSSANHLAVRIVTVTSSGVTVGSETVIGTCQAKVSLASQFPYCYDYVTTSTDAVVVVSNEPNINFYRISTAGVSSSGPTIASSGEITPLTVISDSSGQFWVYWATLVATVQTMNYAVYSSTLTLVTAATAFTGFGVIQPGQEIGQVTAINTGTNTQSCFYSTHSFVGYAESIFSEIQQFTVTTSTISFFTTLGYGTDIIAKPVAVSGTTYIPVVSISQVSPSGFLLDPNDYLPVAKFLQGNAEGIYQQGYTIGGSTTHASILGMRYPGFLNVPQLRSSTVVELTTGYVATLIPITNTPGNSANDVCPVQTTAGLIMGVSAITFNFADTDAFQGVIQQDTLALNGGIVSMYDGNSVSEIGFNIDPDNATAASSSSGGAVPAGRMGYFYTFEWLDKNGNLYQSAPSSELVVTTSGGSSAVTVYMQIAGLAQKPNVIIKLWRSDSTIGDGLAYLVTSIQNPPFVSSQAYLDVVDTYSKDQIIKNPTLYTKNGAVLENSAPPPAMILWTNNNRLWLVDSENPETNIEYCKTASTGTGISFSTGQLEYVVDSKNGAITGASPMDEKTVILKESGAGYFIGDGANDSGTGSTLSNFQFVPSDTGCSNSKSVVLYPGGVLFRANNNKGIYLFSRGVQVQYFGSDVSAYSSQDILSAKIMGDRNQIRFLTSSGSSLLYDYVMNQWSVFTNHTGVSSDIYGGVYTYVRSDGNLYLENQTSTYLDNGTAISPVIQFSWIKASSIQGFERIRRVALLGDFLNANGGHGVQISVAYDFIPTFSVPVPYYFSGSNTVYQYRERLSRQKCDALQFKIQEITTGASGEYIDFSDFGIEIMAKTGLNKLGRTQSVG